VNCGLRIADCGLREQPFAHHPRSAYSAIRNPQSAIAAILLCVALAFTGCAGYQIGARTLYPPDIHTVYVPMFESNSFRRHLGERLTEAVVKEIELKTPYKVVGSPNADSVLSGVIVEDTKRITVENQFDDPRQSELTLGVQVTWLDRRGGLIQQGAVPITSDIAQVSASAKVTPEVGQSIAVGQQAAIQRLAEQIVGLMETPW
jgi:hypothetical protein